MHGTRIRTATATALTLAVAILPGPWGGDEMPRPGTPAPGVPGDPARGAWLFQRFDCTRCHTEPRSGYGIDVPPSLTIAGSRARHGWLANWLRDPEALRYAAEGVRPRIRMPAVHVSSVEMQDLVAYLASLRDSSTLGAGDSEVRGDSTRLAEGAMLFAQYQCLGCHQLDGRGGRVGPALDGVGRRRRPGYVTALLRSPNAVIPGTAMKNFDLWDDEVRALTTYLTSLQDARIPAATSGSGAEGSESTAR